MIGSQEHIDLGLGGVALPILVAARHHIMLEGPQAWTDAVMLCLQPHFRPPVMRNPSGAAFHVSCGNAGALILQDVDRLSADEQTRLLDWMSGASRDTKIVSTTALPLFPFVARGLFDANLYYRLNMLLLRVNPDNRASSQVCTPVQRVTTVRA